MKARLQSTALLALLALSALALPASGHTNHDMKFVCDDPSPSTASSNADSRCVLETQFAGLKVAEIWLDLPVDAKINEVGSGDGTDPAHDAKVGTSTVATDLSYNGCNGGQGDGGTYSTYWRSQPNWTAYTVPAGWTKTAEFRTEFIVLWFFTEQVPTHVIKNNTTGAYRTVTIVPHARGCSGATTDWDITTYGYVNQNSSNPWVARNPSTTGSKTVNLTVVDTGGTSHTDSDTITIT